MAHAFNPSTWEAEVGRTEFKTSLVRVRSRTAKATQKTYPKKPKSALKNI